MILININLKPMKIKLLLMAASMMLFIVLTGCKGKSAKDNKQAADSVEVVVEDTNAVDTTVAQ